MKKNDQLQTPPHIYKVLGHIDLDPCAAQNTSIGAANYVLEHGQDGLLLPWHGFVYCNPPFSQKHKWANRFVQHGNGILILPERGSAPWFAPLAAAAKHYWVMGQKINFLGGPSSNNLGSVLFLFGDEAIRRVLSSGLPGHLVRVEHVVPRNPTIQDFC